MNAHAIGLAVVLSASSLALAAEAATVSELIFFGDSNVDIGRAASPLVRDGLPGLPPPNTVGGRSSDGTIIPDPGNSIPLVRTRGDVRPPQTHWLNRRLYEKHTTAHVLAADFMRAKFYARFRIRPDRLVTLRPGLDVDEFRRGGPEPASARAKLGLPGAARVIGLIGRYTEAKGQLTALEAFARVHARLPNTHFLVSGQDYDISEALLRERAGHLGLGGNIHFVPPAGDVRDLIRAIDLGVVASTASEAICRIALEYMASGVPVVGTNLNSIPEMVRHGVTGLIVPPGDPQALSASIQRLLEDPSARERLGEAGPEHVRKNYNLNHLVDATETLYRRLIREASR